MSNFIENANWRYATKKFDATKKVSKDDLERGLFKIKTPLIKITVGLFILLILLIIGLYFK